MANARVSLSVCKGLIDFFFSDQAVITKSKNITNAKGVILFS